jgi:hypothetical protein
MLQGDCMDFMRDKPDKFWDLAIENNTTLLLLPQYIYLSL